MNAMKGNRRSRILTTVVILTVAVAAGYGQGLLAEGAMKLINSLTNKNTSEQSIFHQTGYSENTTGITDRESSRHVLKSINVEAVEISFEQEVNAEAWMTESFADHVEEGVAVETWMTTPISESMETPVTVEGWMTTPMTQNLESPVAVEAWMTTPMTESLESQVAVEAWMTIPLTENLEEDLIAEAWMSTPLYAGIETTPEIEDWMTDILIEKGSEDNVLESEWMTESCK